MRPCLACKHRKRQQYHQETTEHDIPLHGSSMGTSSMILHHGIIVNRFFLAQWVSVGLRRGNVCDKENPVIRGATVVRFGLMV